MENFRIEFHRLLGKLRIKGKRRDERNNIYIYIYIYIIYYYIILLLYYYIIIYIYMFLVFICCFVLCYLPKLERGMALAFSADLLYMFSIQTFLTKYHISSPSSCNRPNFLTKISHKV